jgi:hypothetical protein
MAIIIYHDNSRGMLSGGDGWQTGEWVAWLGGWIANLGGLVAKMVARAPACQGKFSGFDP